jgi:hypothetical protein
MEDYPRTLQEFEARFSTEEGCREYLFRLRWPEGFRCPRCGCDKAWAVRATLLQCSRCDSQTSVTAGTVFQDTRKPLATWFRAMWFVTSQKNGASALGLQRVLGLGSYRTAWSWLHKLRRAMVRSGRDRLSGWVEVDETYWGSHEEGVAGREVQEKALIVVAAQADGKGIDRIRMRVINTPPPPASIRLFRIASSPAAQFIPTAGRASRIGEEGIRSRGDVCPETTAQRSLHPPASGTPGRFTSEAVASRYTPGGGVTRATAVLPRRVYVSL